MGFKYPPRKENAQPAVDSSPTASVAQTQLGGAKPRVSSMDGGPTPVAICCLMRFGQPVSDEGETGEGGGEADRVRSPRCSRIIRNGYY